MKLSNRCVMVSNKFEKKNFIYDRNGHIKYEINNEMFELIKDIHDNKKDYKCAILDYDKDIIDELVSLEILTNNEEKYIFNIKQPSKLNSARIFLEITDKCNLNCKHCYMDLQNQKQLTDDEVYMKTLKIIDILSDNNINEIMYTGGEIFTFKYAENILEYSKKKGIKNIIFTNGLEFDIKCLKYIDQVNVSLDGDEQIHNYIRGNKKSFKKVMELLDILKERNVWTNLQISLNDNNIDHLDFLPNLLLTHLNIRTVNLTSIINEGNAFKNKMSTSNNFDYKILKLLPDLYEKTKYHIQFRPSLISRYDFINNYINELPIFPVWIDIVDGDYYLIKNSKYSDDVSKFNVKNIEKMCYNIQQKFIEMKLYKQDYINIEKEMESLK